MNITACTGKPLDHVTCSATGTSLPRLCQLDSAVMAQAVDTATLTD